ncbi:MAG TPA: D-alanyl-D-alanine carboxypeptidase [Alphaproteobacteria bacterium]|nr:D-alanyl-D-alanine carboxypeptidase [Alphaproteobacteria bacterium]HCV89156.1 D-alanyl-D-alanine carboxypeptidase [Alphaproteobacteria bacterium]|tara:strand:+ start:3368 stop:4537 length:1170 start_codon:yes stop_codon:yes gene_type:complete
MATAALSCLLAMVAAPISSSNAAEVDSSAEFAFVTDFASGKVLMEKDPDALMKPASMAKIMTVYIAFQRIADGSLSLDDTFLISEKAWRKGGSKTFVEVGKQVSVRDLLFGVVVQSGNDAAIAIAEGISGTEDGFAEEMNYVARGLGMSNTVFRNATGWPDPEQVTTARDLNILATALIRDFPVDEYPELYPMFAEKNFTYNGIKQGNRNPLVYGTQGADGLKTGHTEESGYGLVGSAIRDGQRVIMVLNGMQSMKQRSSESRRLMDLMFREFKLYRFYGQDEAVDRANVWLGTQSKIDLVLKEPLELVLARSDRRKLKVSVQWTDPVPAPIRAGQTVGTLVLELPSGKTSYELLAARDVAALGMFDRVGEALKYLIFGASVDDPVLGQ